MTNMLVCSTCNRQYSIDQPRWRCECGGILDLKIEPVFKKMDILKGSHDMWRYRTAIPVERDENIITQGEGFTPLSIFKLGGSDILVKQDQLFPTGSYKDRGAAVLISKVKELGITRVVEDSSGNAGCSIAAWCARAGIDCQIFTPANTSPAKTTQIKLYGAQLALTPGTREDTARAVMVAASRTYYASHSWNPYFFHGTKTWAFEVWEQLGWQAPDTVILPVGNGTLFLGAYIGFSELLVAGEINKLPRMIAVQSEVCAPLAKAFHEDLDEFPEMKNQDTLAEGIAIATPIRGRQILQAVRDTGGTFMTVSEAEIVKSLLDLGRQGACIEPTSAAATAAATRYMREAGEGERVITTFTGHGLKNPDKLAKLLVDMNK